MSVYHKDTQVENQILEVAQLVVPFTIEGNATASAVVVGSGLPGIVRIATEGNSVTGADSGASVLTVSDATGEFGILVTLGEEVGQVISCSVQRPAATGSNIDPCRFADADGLTASGNIILNVDSAIATTAAVTTLYALTVTYKLA